LERVAGVLLAGAIAMVPVRGLSQSTAARLEPYRDSIPGTLVTFDMVPLAAGPGVKNAVWIGRTEVTWDMYDVFALGLDVGGSSGGVDAVARPSRPYGAPDYGYGHQGYPVISVTRAAAEAFCAWLSAKTGNSYRLPTEEEWLHAARLGPGSAPLSSERRDTLAWHRDNAGGTTHPVATKPADDAGLHDVLGNAAEWVLTPNDELVVRGGSFRSTRDQLEARLPQDETWNERDPQIPKSRWWLSDGPFVGFRIIREPQPPR
jgi:formylglycine-generating enzyme required for sulfatase activity